MKLKTIFINALPFIFYTILFFVLGNLIVTDEKSLPFLKFVVESGSEKPFVLFGIMTTVVYLFVKSLLDLIDSLVWKNSFKKKEKMNGGI